LSGSVPMVPTFAKVMASIYRRSPRMARPFNGRPLVGSLVYLSAA
jgi:hypothetical protein